MNPDLANAEPNPEIPLEDRLVAYLDGELDPAETRRVEQLLSGNVEARQKLHELQQTWDMLGHLDRAGVEGSFTHTTLEMVALEAAVEAKRADAAGPTRRRQRWIAGGVLAAALLAGFAAAGVFWPDPNQKILHDLPILVNLDRYRQVGDIQLLRLLANEHWFDQQRTAGDDTPTAAKDLADLTDDSPAGRRQYVAALSPGDQAELRGREERLAAIEPAAGQRLRDLDAQLQNDPDREQLRKVLRHYGDWAAALPSYTRSELQPMAPDQAIVRIKTLLADQDKQQARRLLPRDEPGLTHWMEQYAAQHETRLLESLPQGRREQLEKMASPARRQASFALIWWRHQLGGRRRPFPFTEEDFAALKAGLSPETQKTLDAKPNNEQRAMMTGWIRHMARRQTGNMKPMLPDDEKLIEFFESDKLTAQQKEDLLSLPPDEMLRDLKHLYLISSGQGDPPRGKPRRSDKVTR